MIARFTVRHLDGIVCEYDAAGKLTRVNVGSGADCELAPETPQQVHVHAANQAHAAGSSGYLTAWDLRLEEEAGS